MAETAEAVHALPTVVANLQARIGADCIYQETVDDVPTVWVPREHIRETMRYLKHEAPKRFELMFDLSGIDERARQNRAGQPDSDFTVFYHLMSLSADEDLRVKVALAEDDGQHRLHRVHLPGGELVRARSLSTCSGCTSTITRTCAASSRRRCGKAIRCARTIRLGRRKWTRSRLTPEFQEAQQEALRFVPEEWGMSRKARHTDFMFLNLGPNHPSVHGVFRIALQLDGEVIVQGRARHRLSPPGAGEDVRAPVVAHLHPLHRSRRLSRWRDEQPALRDERGAHGRHRGATPGAGDRG